MDFITSLFNSWLQFFTGPHWGTSPYVDYAFGTFLGLVVLVIFLAIAIPIWNGIAFLLGPYRYKYSNIKNESGKVVNLDFHRAHSYTSTGTTFTPGGGVGITTMSHYEPEEDNVIIHGKVTGTTVIDNERLFKKVEPGEAVTINYKEKIKYNRHDPHEKTEIVDFVVESVTYQDKEYDA